MWWPNITLDVVQGDLKALSSGSLELLPDDEEFTKCDWSVLSSSEGSIQSSFDKWDVLMDTMRTTSRRLDSVRFDLCMSLFQAYMVKAGLAEQVKASVSPVDYCVASTIDAAGFPSSTCDSTKYKNLANIFDSVCFDITDLVLDHAVVFPPDYVQDLKDIQRDSVCINGSTLLGANVGYDNIVKTLEASLPSNSEELAKSILSIGNRTFSGGVAFDKVLSVLRSDEVVLVSPVSSDAEPIDVVVLKDRVLIRCHTRYSIMPAHDESWSQFKVDGFTMVEVGNFELVNSRGFVWINKVLL